MSKIVGVEITFEEGIVHRFSGNDAAEWMRIMNDALMWKQCNDGVRAPCPTFQVQTPNGDLSFVQRDSGGTRSDRIPCTACNGRGWIEKEKKEKDAPKESAKDAPAPAAEVPVVPAAEAPLATPVESVPPPNSQGSLFG